MKPKEKWISTIFSNWLKSALIQTWELTKVNAGLLDGKFVLWLDFHLRLHDHHGSSRDN